MRLLLIAALIIAPFSYSSAADGVLEINQTCAAGPGCFPGDEPGFPVRILNSGSYVLTSNLVLPPLEDGITTRLNDTDLPSEIRVSLNLNGFSISSTTTCSGQPLICSPTSTTDGVGILLGAVPDSSIHIQNGTVKGLANVGVLCAGACVIRNLVVSENGSGGIRTNGALHGVLARRNGGLAGFHVVNDGVVQNSTSTFNAGHGFFGGGSYIGNQALLNGDAGFFVIAASLSGNTVNGATTGIHCQACSAHNNVITDVQTGIDFDDDEAVYGGNVIFATTAAVANAGDAIQSYANSCQSTPCP